MTKLNRDKSSGRQADTELFAPVCITLFSSIDDVNVAVESWNVLNESLNSCFVESMFKTVQLSTGSMMIGMTPFGFSNTIRYT
jgi:hypothetical protein